MSPLKLFFLLTAIGFFCSFGLSQTRELPSPEPIAKEPPLAEKPADPVIESVAAPEDSEPAAVEKPGEKVVPPKPVAVKPKTTALEAENERILKHLSLRQKVGQLFIFGFMGETIEGGLGKTIKTLQPGAIIVFGRNIKTARQTSELNYQAQSLSLESSGVPLLIAVDQEGGSVVRIKTAPPLPSALALGETGDNVLVHDAGYHTGILLKSLGFNMNLAPVLDVSDPEENSFIGTRTFGNSPALVSEMGQNFAGGLIQAGILPTGKHFPGHGDIMQDPHRTTPSRTRSLEQLWNFDLIPFTKLTQELNGWAIMTGHVAYPSLDATNMPATFSKPIVTDLLRKKIGFNGLVMTDDIEMAGAFAIKDVRERAVRAVEAGVDMVMVAWNKRLQNELVHGLYSAVKSGRISEARIDESVRRILLLKRRYVSFKKPQRPTNAQLLAALRSSALRRVSEQTLKSKFDRSLAGFNRDSLDSISPRPVFVFSGNEQFFRSFKDEIKNHPTRFYQLSNNQHFDIDRVMRANPLAYGVFYVNGTHSAAMLNHVASDSASRLIVVNTETQGVLQNPGQFKYVIDVYFRHPSLGKMTAFYFFGEPPSGRVPATKPTKE